jgi:hypothetical protein
VYADQDDLVGNPTRYYVVSTIPVTPHPVVLHAMGLERRSGFPCSGTIVAIALVESYEIYGSPDQPRTHQQEYKFVVMTKNYDDEVESGIPEIDHNFRVVISEPEVEDPE